MVGVARSIEVVVWKMGRVQQRMGMMLKMVNQMEGKVELGVLLVFRRAWAWLDGDAEFLGGGSGEGLNQDTSGNYA